MIIIINKDKKGMRNMEFTLHGSDFTLTPRSDELEEHELRVFKLGGLNDAEHSFEVNDDGFKIKMATFEL